MDKPTRRLTIFMVLSVLGFAAAIGAAIFVVAQEARISERVEVIERELISACEEPRSERCRESLDLAIRALTPRQAAVILRKARAFERRQERREQARRRARQGGDAQQTAPPPSQQSGPPPGGLSPGSPPGAPPDRPPDGGHSPGQPPDRPPERPPPPEQPPGLLDPITEPLCDVTRPLGLPCL